MTGPALPVLPKDFDELTKHLSAESRRAELRQRRAAFNSARARLQKWIQKDRNPLMTKTAKLIAVYLLGCVNFETGRCNPTHETIADEFGISERHVRRLLPKIKQAGWISYRRAAHNRPTFYTFHAATEAIERIEESAATLKQEREQRRQERHERRSVRTSMALSVRTSMSAEHKSRTYDNSSSAREKNLSGIATEGEAGENYAALVSTTPGALTPDQQRAICETAEAVIPEFYFAAVQRSYERITNDRLADDVIHALVDELSTELRKRMS